MSIRSDNIGMRINTRLETFLAKELGMQNVDFYDQEPCVEVTKNVNIFAKYPFRILIVCKEKIIITNNPPKKEDLNRFICFNDILDIKVSDDVPAFLGNPDRDKAMHISITYCENPLKKKSMNEIKKKIIELKKDMLYEKTLNDRLNEMDSLNSARTSFFTGNNTFRSDYLNEINNSTFRSEPFSTFKFDPMNKTVKSVRFDQENENKQSNDKNDHLTEKATAQRYKKLTEFVSQTSFKKEDQILNLSLPIAPTTPRSNDLSSMYSLNTSMKQYKSLESLNESSNFKFIQDSDKNNHKIIDLYTLNPGSNIFSILKTAHFNSKIKATLSYHKNEYSKSESISIKKSNEFEKKFLQIKSEIKANIDDLEETSKLLNEIIRAANSYNSIKIHFWNHPDFYCLIISQLIRFLPKSPANMSLSRAPNRRIKELECCIDCVEILCVMFYETEFFKNRNEVLSLESCRLLEILIGILVCDPELAETSGANIDQDKYLLREKLLELAADFNLVSAILLYEILNSAWHNENFNFDNSIQNIENSPDLPKFIHRLIDELTKIIVYNEDVLLSAGQTVIIFKIFSLFKIIMEKSTKKILLAILQENYQEEFKYYFNEDKIKSKCFNYYPVFQDLIATIKRLESILLE